MEIILQNYIGGELLSPLEEAYIHGTNPATGETFALVPDSTAKDVDLAVESAQSAFPSWSETPAKERSKILHRIAELIETKYFDQLVEAETTDNGKPLHLSRNVDIPRAAANFHFFASAILHTHTEAFPNESTSLNYTLRQPIGVVGCISPWNLPLYLFTWKIAPALAAGCTVVGKPSEITPYTSFLLSKICMEAGLPAGVLNIVHGTGPKAGRAITSHPEIKAISFTGGTKTGAEISRIAAPMFKKLSLELGGKNPNIIFEDCNYDKMIETTLRSSFSNQGQICLCGSRIFVQEGIYDRFKKDFVKKTEQLKVGDPLAPTTDVGAVVSEAHLNKILNYIELAKEEGGTMLTGGNRIVLEGRCKNGYFVAPTIIEGLDQQCRTNQEEIFGPVVTLAPFKKEEEAIQMANATQYGLSATVWTQNLNVAHRVANKLQAGIVWINTWMLRDLRTYFGGMKQSGVGREGGFQALNFFTEAKNVTIDFT